MAIIKSRPLRGGASARTPRRVMSLFKSCLELSSACRSQQYVKVIEKCVDRSQGRVPPFKPFVPNFWPTRFDPLRFLTLGRLWRIINPINLKGTPPFFFFFPFPFPLDRPYKASRSAKVCKTTMKWTLLMLLLVSAGSVGLCGRIDGSKVQIKVYRGPTQSDSHHHSYAPWGFWVKQPSDNDHRWYESDM